MKNTTLLLTCEHGGNNIPPEYRPIFSGFNELLKTHRGYDLGVESLAIHFSEILKAKLFKTDISRLLVDTNRSLWRRTIFSEITKKLPKNEKQKILDKYYYPHNNAIEAFVEKEISTGEKIIHIALHTFTPILNSVTRTTDIGLLYNPARGNEKHFCALWKRKIQGELPEKRVRYNYPYLGKPDGVAARLRKKHNNQNYLGIEFEVNQKFANSDNQIPPDFCISLVSSFKKTLDEFTWL